MGYGYVAVLAALEHRRRTGRGQYIDLSQYENGIQFLAPAILQYQLLGTAPTRQVNRHDYAVPHGVYPCAGDENWCSISVFGDPEWQRLVNVMGNPQWAQSLRFATQLARKENEAELDKLLGQWTRSFRADDLMHTLQKTGVHAAKINNMADLFSDPQLAHRRFWRTVQHKEVNPHHIEMPAFELSSTPCAEPTAEPLLCEHTELVLENLLALSQAEIERLATEGAVELANSKIGAR